MATRALDLEDYSFIAGPVRPALRLVEIAPPRPAPLYTVEPAAIAAATAIVEPAVAPVAISVPAPVVEPEARRMPPSWLIAPAFRGLPEVKNEQVQAAPAPMLSQQGPYRSIREVPKVAH